MKVESPYLTVEEAADYLRCKTVNAFYCFRYQRKKKGYPVIGHWRGGVLLFRQIDLDRAMEPERVSKPARPARTLHVVGGAQ